MFIIITRAVHIGACLVLVSVFAFEMLITTPALRPADRSALEYVEALRGQFRWVLVWSGFAGIGSGIAWFWFSFGLGEGGEQNAPLGRAVIGGLIFATFATLFFVPVVYSMLRREQFVCDEDEQFEREERRTSTDEKQPEDE